MQSIAGIDEPAISGEQDLGAEITAAKSRWEAGDRLPRRQPSEEEIEVWNAFMTKRGWRDAGTQRLNERLAEIGLPPGTVQTMFEFIDLDEGRRQTGSR